MRRLVSCWTARAVLCCALGLLVCPYPASPQPVLGKPAGDPSQPESVVGAWALCPAHGFELKFTEYSFASSYNDAEFVAQSGGSYEKGTYVVWEDSLALHITDSDFAGRTGKTVVVTCSVADFSITLTNAPELTCGYVDEEQVRLTVMEGTDNAPFGWWEIHDPEQVSEYSPLSGVHLTSCGSLYTYWPHGQEWGTFTVHGDSLEVTISESEAPDRVGARSAVAFGLEWPYGPGITFTNAPMLTAGFTDEETITLTRGITGSGVRSQTWGALKRSAR